MQSIQDGTLSHNRLESIRLLSKSIGYGLWKAFCDLITGIVLEILLVIGTVVYIAPVTKHTVFTVSPEPIEPEAWRCVYSRTWAGSRIILSPKGFWIQPDSHDLNRVQAENWEWWRLRFSLRNLIDKSLASEDWLSIDPIIEDTKNWARIESHPSIEELRKQKTVCKIAQGWPFRAFVGEIAVSKLGDAKVSRSGTHAIIISRSGSTTHPWLDTKILPLRPIFPGILFDAWFCFFAFYLVVSYLSLFAIIYRHRNQRCLSCGYNRRYSLSVRCPECGELGRCDLKIYFRQFFRRPGQSLLLVLVISGTLMILSEVNSHNYNHSNQGQTSIIQKNEALRLAWNTITKLPNPPTVLVQITPNYYGWYVEYAYPDQVEGFHKNRIIIKVGNSGEILGIE